MTPHADLTALLADAGIIDVDVDRAVEDEHVRIPAYLEDPQRSPQPSQEP